MNDNITVTTGIRDLLASERGVVFLLLMVTCSVLLGLSVITADQWLEFAKWATLTLIVSKTITTAIDSMTKPKTVAAASSPAPASPA